MAGDRRVRVCCKAIRDQYGTRTLLSSIAIGDVTVLMVMPLHCPKDFDFRGLE